MIVFAKLPEEGLVKTRLAEAVGARRSTDLYRAWVPPFVEMLTTSLPGGSVEISLAAGGEAASAHKWLPFPVDFSLQEGEGLSERLTNAFDRAFSQGWGPVVILGSDSPQLEPEDIRANIRLLEDHDMILGPAEDGGYYLIGLNQVPGDLFDGVSWSCRDTREETVRAAHCRGWQVGLGPETYDIDTLPDLERLLREDYTGRWDTLRDILKP